MYPIESGEVMNGQSRVFAQDSTITAHMNSATISKILHIFLRILSLLPIATLFQGFPALSSVNKLLIAVSVLLPFFAFFLLRMSVMAWMQLLLTMCLTVIALMFTREALFNANMPVYLLFFVLLLVLVSEQGNTLRGQLAKDVRWYRAICVIWCLLVVVSLPMAISYDKDGFFTSYTGNSFRTDPAALLILTYLILLVRCDSEHRLSSVLMSFVPLYCGLMGASRTYFFVILLTYVVFLRCVIKTRKAFVVCMLFGFIVMIPIVFMSNIGQRMINSVSDAANGYYGFWATITSGRSRFWTHDLQGFFDLSFINQLIGAGFNQVFIFNKELGTAIWAHNDFLNILITNGYVGLFVYVFTVYRLFRFYCRSQADLKSHFLLIILSIWFFNAFFNMVYTYTCAAVALAILPLVLGDSKEYK